MPVCGESQISWTCLKAARLAGARLRWPNCSKGDSSRVVWSMMSSSSRAGVAELVADAAAFVPGQLLGLHQTVDVGAVAGVGWDPAGRGVRLHEVAARLQLRHLVAHRRRADAKVVLLGRACRADRLRGVDVLVNDRRQDEVLPLVEFALSRSSLEVSSLAGECQANPQAYHPAGGVKRARSIAPDRHRDRLRDHDPVEEHDPTKPSQSGWTYSPPMSGTITSSSTEIHHKRRMRCRIVPMSAFGGDRNDWLTVRSGRRYRGHARTP